MNGADLLRIVDLMHREKNISKEVIFEGIEAAVQADHFHDLGMAQLTDAKYAGEFPLCQGLFQALAHADS